MNQERSSGWALAGAMPPLLAAALLQAAGLGSAAAATLQISQVVDRSPELAVFLSGGMPAAPAGAKAAPQITAALGAAPLALKSVAPWLPTQAISLVVALDVSASIGRTNFETLKRVLADLMARLPAGSQVALLAIGEDVRTVMPFGAAADAASALDTLVPNSPETALYEAVLAGQQLAARASAKLPLRRVVLVVTDGIDDSRHGFGREETVRKINEGDAPVFAMAVVAGNAAPAQREAVKSLAQIARASGGGFVQTAAANAGASLDRLMVDATRARLLTLDCSACVRDGVVRTLQLSDGVSGDSRGVRLLAPVQAEPVRPAPAPAPVPSPAPAPASPAPVEHDWWKDVLGALRVAIAALKLWQWAVILAMTLALAAAVRKLLHDHRPRPGEDKPGGDGGEGGEGSETLATGLTDGVRIVGARARPGESKTVTLDIAGQGRRQMHIGAAEVVLGRSKRSDVPMEADAEASNRHAALYVLKDALMLRDLDSANGTYLNGTRIERPEPVQDRDLLRVGRTEVRVYMGAA